MKRLALLRRNVIWVVAYTLVVVGAWEFFVWYFGIADYLLPAPSAIYGAVRGNVPSLSRHTLVTLWEILLGFALGTGLGVLLAILIGAVRPLRITLLPPSWGSSPSPRWPSLPSWWCGSALAWAQRSPWPRCSPFSRCS